MEEKIKELENRFATLEDAAMLVIVKARLMNEQKKLDSNQWQVRMREFSLSLKELEKCLESK